MATGETILGLVLAGGRSSRFGGGEKAAGLLHGRTLLDLAVERLRASCAAVAVSAAAGSEVERLAQGAGLPVLHDAAEGPRGPLCGLLAGLAWARREGAGLLAPLPCDVPHAPEDLVARLASALTPNDGAAVARTPDGLQSLCTLLRTGLEPALATLLARGEHPPVHEWLADVRAREVAFADGAAFANLNTREDLSNLADPPSNR